MQIKPLLAVLSAYFFLATLYNFAIPAGEAPDEPEHARYTRIILETGQFPTIPLNSARYAYEAEQPPLYYVLSAGWIGVLWPDTQIFPTLQGNPDFSFDKDTPYNVYLHTYPGTQDIPVHLQRLLSTLIGLLTLVLIWLAAREVWPASESSEGGSVAEYAPLVSVGFAALIPGFTFTSATITNDTLAATLGAAVTYFSLRIIRRGATPVIAVCAGVALGLGLLSKYSLVVYALLPVLACLLAARQAWRDKIINIGVVAVSSAVIGVWPFLSNLFEYGDPFATAARMAAKNDIVSPLADLPFFWLDRGYIAGLLDSLWGVFGLRNVPLPSLAYVPYYVLFVVGVCAALYSMRRSSSVQRKQILLLIVALVLIYAGVAYQNTQFWAVQGRLLLPGLCALALLVGGGMSIVFSSLSKRLSAVSILPVILLAFLFLLNLYALIGKLIASYYG